MPAIARKKTAEVIPLNSAVEASVERIWAAFREHQLPGIFKTGEVLKVEKERLKSEAAWMAMFKDHDMPFTRSTADKLIAIAGCAFLRDCSHGNTLPLSWTTLYALATLTPEQFAKGIKSGAINPKMERSDALALKPRPKLKKKKHAAAPDDEEIPTAEECDQEGQETVYEQCLDFVKHFMTDATRQKFFAAIGATKPGEPPTFDQAVEIVVAKVAAMPWNEARGTLQGVNDRLWTVSAGQYGRPLDMGASIARKHAPNLTAR
jgi:hypothetical protein